MGGVTADLLVVEYITHYNRVITITSGNSPQGSNSPQDGKTRISARSPSDQRRIRSASLPARERGLKQTSTQRRRSSAHGNIPATLYKAYTDHSIIRSEIIHCTKVVQVTALPDQRVICGLYAGCVLDDYLTLYKGCTKREGEA